MTTITVHIDKEKDLTEISEVLNKLGLDYTVDKNEWADLSDAEIEGIKVGLDDIKQGRFSTNEEVKNRINKKLQDLRSSK